MVLEVGDCVLEVSRFNKREYTIYRIDHIDPDDGVKLFVIKSSTFRAGGTVSGYRGAFYGHRNCKWLCYYLPAGKILYAEAKEREI